MIITVIAMRMMEVTTHEVVRVPTVRDRLMPTAGSVLVVLLVLAARVSGGALVGIRGRDCDLVLVHMVAMLIMQMPIVQVIRVPVVLDRRVTTAGLVFVTVPRMALTCGAHLPLSFVLGFVKGPLPRSPSLA